MGRHFEWEWALKKSRCVDELIESKKVCYVGGAANHMIQGFRKLANEAA